MEITIQRFKNIESVTIPAKGIVLLVGGNNSGKSSVLQAIQFGISVAQTTKMQSTTWGADDRLPTSLAPSDLVYSPIKDVNALAANGRLREAIGAAISVHYRDDNESCRITVRKGRNKNMVVELVGQTLGEKLQSFTEPYCALVTGLAGIPSEEQFETDLIVRKTAARGDSNSVFRNILWQLKSDQSRWAGFEEQIRRIFPNYTLHVEFDPQTDEYINCEVEKDGIKFPIDTCGTGVLQAVQIFSYINLFRPKLLLLDEPDSHLHPNNQIALAKELLAAAENGLNIIISSHSKHLITPLLDSSTLVWLRRGARESNADGYEVKALMEIGALGVGERIGNPSHIFLTEDKSTSLLELLLESNGYSEADYEIISYCGCTNLQTAIVLINQLKKSHPSAKYAVHRDRDFMTDAELVDYQTRLANMGVKVFLPEKNDLETYFVTPEHIAGVTGVNTSVASEIIEAAFSARKDDMLALYINTRIINAKRNGQQVNAGEIGVEANTALSSVLGQGVHGKTMLSGVRDELRRRGIVDSLATARETLKADALRNLWPT